MYYMKDIMKISIYYTYMYTIEIINIYHIKP